MARKTRSDKKTRYKKCRRKKALYQGVTVVLPCKATKLTPRHRAMIDDEYTASRWNKCKVLAKKKKGSCRVVFFKANQPVMRMSDKKLSTPAKKAAGRKRAKKQCRYAKTARKGQRGRFKRC